MIALKIDNVKQFTSKLFVGAILDKFLMREVTTVIYNMFTIDGHIKQGYYVEAELEEDQIEGLSSWVAPKPFCFSLIRGRKLPGSFQIVLQIVPADVEAFLGRSRLAAPVEQITGLYANTRYGEGQLTYVTGTPVDFFTLDKSLDREQDETVRQFLKGARIVCMEEQKQEGEKVIMAELYFRYGTMGSSKTAGALVADYNYRERSKQALLVKPKAGFRGGNQTVRSRMGLEKERILLEELVEMTDEEIRKYDYIIVDEAQLTARVQMEFFVHIMDDLDAPVICYGPRTDLRREFFEGSLWLMVWTDKIEGVKTVCWYRKAATCNARIGEGGKMIQSEGQIVVGGNGKYTALCRKHHREGNLGR